MLAMVRRNRPESADESSEPRKSIERRSAYSALSVKLTNTTEVVTNAVTIILQG